MSSLPGLVVLGVIGATLAAASPAHRSVHDPATPYVWSQRMHDAIPGSVLLTYEGGQHVAWTGVSPDCVEPAGGNYMINLVLPPPNSHCPYRPS